MRRIRLTISSLLAIVLVIGVGFAALRESNEIWDSGVFTLTLGVLLISILLAVHRIESRRAFWIGFALFGWTYLGLSLVPSIESRLITTRALASSFQDAKIDPSRTRLRRFRRRRQDRPLFRKQSATERPRSQQGERHIRGRNLSGSVEDGGVLEHLSGNISKGFKRHNRELRSGLVTRFLL